MPSRAIRFAPEQINQIVRHTKDVYPHEAVGLIGGRDARVTQLYPLPNAADSPESHFSAPPDALFKAYQHIETTDDIELLGVYHSHPQSAPIPSDEDIRHAQYNTPNVAHVIISLRGTTPELKAWHISPTRQVTPVEILIGSEQAVPNTTLTPAQKYAIIVAVGLALCILWGVSFTLLPPAPAIPTPAP